MKATNNKTNSLLGNVKTTNVLLENMQRTNNKTSALLEKIANKL